MEFLAFAFGILAVIFGVLWWLEVIDRRYWQHAHKDYQDNYLRMVDEKRDLKEEVADLKQVLDSIHALSRGYGPEEEKKPTTGVQSFTWTVN